MKKLNYLFAAVLLLLSLTACGGTSDREDVTTNQGDSTENNMMNGTETGENSGTNDTNTTSGDRKIELADEAADKVASLEEVESANVLVTNQNAYVGVVLKEGVNSNKELETKIADEVKATNADFANVYVSLNPDFAKQLTEYGDKIRAGDPVEGFFTEFTDAVNRMFPNAK